MSVGLPQVVEAQMDARGVPSRERHYIIRRPLVDAGGGASQRGRRPYLVHTSRVTGYSC